jgi:hypothetical protein
MKANTPAIIAILLWLLFFVSEAFAVCKSPYPPKPYPPDQIIIISGTDGEKTVGTANKPE